MLDKAVEQFFSEQRKKTEKNKSGVFDLESWLPRQAENARQIYLSSHPCTFSHPDAHSQEHLGEGIKTTALIADATCDIDGLLRSGNVKKVTRDAFGNGAVIVAGKFLTLTLADGRYLIDHITDDTKEARAALSIKSVSYEELRANFLKAVKHEAQKAKSVTSSKIKQVYFPVDQTYHQLSLLTASGITQQLYERIRERYLGFSKLTEEARKQHKENEYSETGYDSLVKLAVTQYGGANPQNISVFNSKQHGDSYLLPSLPPNLRPNKIRLPTKDFFADCLWAEKYRDRFQRWQKLLGSPTNNRHIRQKRDNIIKDLFDQIVKKVLVMRQQGDGWSERLEALPAYQKDVLDAGRQRGAESIDTFLTESARWIILSYEKITSNAMFDQDISHAKEVVTECRNGVL